MDRSIYWPLVAQTALVTAVAIRMYRVRVSEMRARRVAPQTIATSREAAERLQNVAAADNFRNLFEVPVLFYAVCLALATSGLVSPVQVGLAWAYVAARAVHSVIHVTYNRVMHRFQAFVISNAILLAMWILFAAALARDAAA
jgi:hypothetical protein